MINNVYVLYIDNPKSIQYKDDCVKSCDGSGMNVIPVQGYNGASYKDICEEFGVHMIPFYLSQMPQQEQILNRVFSCTAGHMKIWQMIVESKEPGIILEHDAIVKGPLSQVEVDDDEILWLGPRIDQERDYRFPIGSIPDYIDVDRWEGTHAYAITPKTAQYLLDSIRKHGLNDSIDGQLGMRNIFDMKFTAIDPPPVVAVVGNRDSCIENTGNPGFWNAIHTPKFLRGCREGVKMAPERKLLYGENKNFKANQSELFFLLSRNNLTDGRELSVLVLGDTDGYATNWLSNNLLKHHDSFMKNIATFKRQEETIYKYNTYFSKYYYKIAAIPVSQDDLMLANAVDDPDIRFDVIFVEGLYEFKDMLYNATVCFNLLNEDGLLIFSDYETNKKVIDTFILACDKCRVESLGNLKVIKRLR